MLRSSSLLTFLLSAQLLTCSAGSCIDSELSSLLKFKTTVVDPDNRLSSWQGRECCGWTGVTCNNQTGLVTAIDLHASNLNGGSIDRSLLQLKSLNYLDLSSNSFNRVTIPGFIGSLTRLQYLNLSNSGFSGAVPSQLGNLSRLQYLDLSSSFSQLMVDDFRWVSRLSSLVHLAMNGVDLSMVGADWIHALNSVPSLTELHLSACRLSGIAPSLPVLNFTSLTVLDVGSNSFNSAIPVWFANLSSLVYLDANYAGLHSLVPTELAELPNLRYLDLSANDNLTADCSTLLTRRQLRLQYLMLGSNRVYGSLPASIGNISSLTELDLSDNEVEGGIPSSIGKLRHLETLNLDGNNLSLGLPESVDGTLPNLVSLRLSNNKLTGVLPQWLGELHSLAELNLGYNSISGSIPPSLGNLFLLTDLGLQGNQLNGSIPTSLGQLSQLVILDISLNQLTGNVTDKHLSNLGNLKIFSMSANSLVVNICSTWIAPFHVRNLGMGSCRMGPLFPQWLQHQSELKYLDVSNASISGELPAWLWDLSSNLSLLNISFNQIEGKLPDPLNIGAFTDVDMRSNLLTGPIPILSNQVELLDLSHNQLTGPIPTNFGELQSNLIYLSLSNNNLTGRFPASIGEMQGLQVLDLSRNNLVGSIPPTLQNCSYLKALGLDRNHFSGDIPPLGGLQQLRTLHLSGNMLSGEIPRSLQNCSNLETLDLGDNGLVGVIPTWLGENLSHLRILRLRSNMFNGQTPPQLSNLSSLQVLDLAGNELVGAVPRSLGDLKSMAIKTQIEYLHYGFYRGNYYEESISMQVSNRQLVYSKTLSLLTSIDLSGNKLTGVIPESLTKLYGLLVLDLSRNRLSGVIPETIGSMHEMLSLDLSSNLLSGDVPTSLSSMSFLSYLNLSRNNLSGRIPSSGQLQTFDASAYSGNADLCGAPLDECEERGGGGVDDRGGDSVGEGLWEDKWFGMSAGLGFAVGVLGLLAVISIRKPWSVAYFRFVDQTVDGMLQVKHVSPQDCRSWLSAQL